MADTTTAEIKSLRPGQYVLVDGEICRVSSIDVTKSGKHGAAKARLEAMGLFDGRRRSIVKPGSSVMEVPIILKKTAQLLAISGDKAQLMDMTDYTQFDADIPEELRGKLAEGGEVMYWEIAGKRILRETRS